MNRAVVLRCDGCDIHYWLTGDAARPLLVLTHGAGANHRMFDAQLPALAAGYRVLTWDVRAHGLSRPNSAPFTVTRVVDDLKALLDAIGCERAVIGGQSMGGNVAQEFVRRHPERTRALLLIDCACNTASLSTLEKVALKLTPGLLKLYPFEQMLKDSAKASALTPAARDYVAEAMRTIPKDEIVTILTEVTGILRDDPHYRIPVPFLLVRGDHDNAGAIKKQAEPWSKREPNCAGYVVIPNAGHCANMDNPAHFNRVMLRFLDALPAQL